MSQNPLDNIRKRQAVEKRSFPYPRYDELFLQPSRQRGNASLVPAAVQIHRARIVDLVEIRTLERSDATAALQALAGELSDERPGQQPLDVIGQVLDGPGGGRALLGSAPEEVERTAARIVLREHVLGMLDALVALRAATAKLALGHLTTSVTVTSNGQMVQPTTLGHYFTSMLGPIDRVAARLCEAYTRLNLSPLGSVSGMATAVPMRRERQAELLGFDGLVAHTFDALAAGDGEHELASIITGLSLELLRVVNDLSEWSRDDVGTIVPSEEFVHSGGAQPQRRDPLVLEHLHVALTEQAGAAGRLSDLHLGRSMIAGPVTRQRSFRLVESTLQESMDSLEMMTRLLTTLEVNRALTANRAHKGFATSSELADLLAIDYSLSRTDAYVLAERIATEATVLALGGMTLDTKLVDRLALEVIGREIGIEPETLGKCLSVKRFVERREVPGGPAPAAVRSMIEQEHLARRRLETWLADARERLDAASTGLEQGIDSILSEVV